MTTRPSTAAPILAVLAIVLVPLVAYVGGYFWLGQYVVSGPYHIRLFHNERMAGWFWPLGEMESRVRGETVHLSWPMSDAEVDLYLQNSSNR